MTPTPQEHPEMTHGVTQHTPQSGDNIVISGMAALLPSCENIEQFTKKLYDKVNFVKETLPRWGYSHPELPSYAGIIPGLDRFDAQFFSVNHRLANSVDAQSRKLLELSYSAIFDAGVSALELSGKKVGVFIATSLSEAEQFAAYGLGKDGIAGSNRAMFANRISYYLNTVGPSMVVDCNSCGALLALEKAQHAIQQGICDAAIVGASKILLHAQSALHHGRTFPMNKTGETRCYDKKADGQSMSEAIHVVYLQKQQDARRIYATLCHVKTGFTDVEPQKNIEYGYLKEPKSFENFLRGFYKEVGVPSSCVNYVEGLGAAYPETDSIELEIIDKVFTKDRKTSLPVGSVASNIGFTEAVSGLSSITKVLLAYQTGYIAPNLHCQDPLDIKAIRDGSLRIVNEKEHFDRSYAALNCVSFSGVHGHALLKGCYIPKDENKYNTAMPYLVAVSGRHKPAVDKIFKWVSEHPIDAEEVHLLNTIHKCNIKLHLARGFAIYSKIPNEVPKILKAEVDLCDDLGGPLWFVYSGMGSQWAGMGKDLMGIPKFAEAIHRCDRILSPKGIDIVDIITSNEKPIFDNILHSFVGIAAVQIGITDVLKSVGIVPDKIIGHSVGELGCAYADGCVTSDEMILLAYYRGRVSLETEFVRGSMAAVGLSYKAVSKLLPPELDVACHNSAESSTISGPAEAMQKFVAELTSQGIFAKEVACSNIAYHSRYIAKAGPLLHKYCKKVITTPKLRSDRWVSTSVPEEEWATKAKYSSAEYHVNNLLSPVLFEETSQLIPNNAVLIEIAPHSLLQGILQRVLPKTSLYIPLTRRGHPNNAALLLAGMGKLYQKGFSVDVNAIYPKVEYPVSSETRSLSQLTDWEHSHTWSVFSLKDNYRKQTAIYKPIITLHDEEHKCLKGYSIGGKLVLPFAAVLNYVWDTLAMTLQVQKETLSVKFENVYFYSQPLISETTSLRLSVQVQTVSGQFEVMYDQGAIANGYVFVESSTDINKEDGQSQKFDMDIDSSSIYRRFYERGYQLRDVFQVLQKSSKHLNHAELAWTGNWVTFIDGMLQMMILKNGHDGISKLEHIQNLTINSQYQSSGDDCSNYEFGYDELKSTARCGPVQIQNVTFKNMPCATQDPVIRYQKFIPFDQQKSDFDTITNVNIYLQIVSENVNNDTLNVYEIKSHEESVIKTIEDNSSLQDKMINKTVLHQNQIKNMNENDFTNVDVIILNKIDSQANVFEVLYKLLPRNAFIINISHYTDKVYPMSLYKIIASANIQNSRIELAFWRPTSQMSSTALTVKSPSQFAFVRDTFENLPQTHKMLIFTSYPPPIGFKDLVKELRSRRSGVNQVLAAIIDEASSESGLDESANLDLAFNVFRQGKWGGEYFIPEYKNTQKCIDNVVLQIQKQGDLSSLSWVETSHDAGAGIPVKVCFAGLNVYDAKVASAELIPPSSEGFGMDFSGVTKSGVPVMGMVTSGAATTVVKAKPVLLWPVPAHWSLEDAATVALPYCIAFYCLGIVVNLHRRQRIFVHGGAGAVGQAVISIALAHDCQVFTTVSDMQKKRFLQRLFPDLPADHIGNSRDQSFTEMVMMKTKGYGCEIIISSVKGELKNSTLRCCANSGTTIDLVQMHTREDFQYGMSNMTLARSYVPIDFAAILKQENTQDIVQKLHSMVSEGIRKGYVRPLSRVCYDAHEARRALNLLATSRHRGRVLLNMNTLTPEIVIPKFSCNPDRTKLIFCDEQELSLQLIDTLIKHGAKKLILHSTKSSGVFRLKNEIWKHFGAQVNEFVFESGNKDIIQEIFKEASKLGAVDGIFIISMDPNSSLRNAMTDIDQISRQLAPHLRHFAVITQDQEIGHTTYVNRVQNKLPSCRIQLSNPEKYEMIEEMKNSKRLSHKSSLKAIMSILSQEDASAIVYANPKSDSGILAQLHEITDIQTENVNDDTTLEELGIDENNAQVVCNIAENSFGTKLKKADVPFMTIRRLKSLEVSLKDVTSAEGLNGQFAFIDSDEITATWEIFAMKTFLQNSNMRINEFCVNALHLCIIPGLEGHHKRFEQLCERLKLRAMVLQPGFDRPHENLDDIAVRLVKVMRSKIGLNKEFCLLGYEFGVEIALKMARILENSGLTGTVYCLGGDPTEIKTTLLSQLNYSNEEELEDGIIQHIHRKLHGNNLEELEMKLKSAKSWREKVNSSTRLLKGTQSNQYIKDLIETLYSRIKLLKQNEPAAQLLRSRIIFLRGNVQEKLPASILKKIHGENIVVQDINANLADLPVDLRIPDYINKYLSEENLNEYNKSNHCETVILF